MIWVFAAIAAVVIAAICFAVVLKQRLRIQPRVLMLHSLRPRWFDISAVRGEQFEQLLQVIAECGLRVGTLEAAVADRGVVALTFDDGYDDLMQLLPVLEQKRIAITVFMPTAFIGKPNSWDNFLLRDKRRHLDAVQIRQLAAAGASFGSHGHSHGDLCALPTAKLQRELVDSKAILEELTGREVRQLAFPFGRGEDRVIVAAKAAGFTHCWAAAPRRAFGSGCSRVAINAFDSRFTMRAKLTGSLLGGIEVLKAAAISRCAQLTPLSRKIL